MSPESCIGIFENGKNGRYAPHGIECHTRFHLSYMGRADSTQKCGLPHTADVRISHLAVVSSSSQY